MPSPAVKVMSSKLPVAEVAIEGGRVSGEVGFDDVEQAVAVR